MSKLIASKRTQWLVVSDLPDVCKTPMGSSTPPVPYPVTAELTDAIQEVKNVKSNGYPLVVFDQSQLVTTYGDEAGVAKGVKSGTVSGKCFPLEHSNDVRAGKKYIVREGDKFGMNG